MVSWKWISQWRRSFFKIETEFCWYAMLVFFLSSYEKYDCYFWIFFHVDNDDFLRFFYFDDNSYIVFFLKLVSIKNF